MHSFIEGISELFGSGEYSLIRYLVGSAGILDNVSDTIYIQIYINCRRI